MPIQTLFRVSLIYVTLCAVLLGLIHVVAPVIPVLVTAIF